MTDIVERLRERSQNLWTTGVELRNNRLFKEAADEIERLRSLEKAGKARKKASQRLARAALEQQK